MAALVASRGDSEAEAAVSDSDGDLPGSSVSPGEDGESDVAEENADKNPENPTAGWADAMAKILNKKTPLNRPTILAKNKEKEKEKEKLKQERLEKKKQLDERREWEQLCRVKPDVIKDRENEKMLQRLATRGVVQLFNAVRKHQGNVDEKVKEAGRSDLKRAKLMSTVSKKDFINVLRGSEDQKVKGTSVVKAAISSKQVQIKSEDDPAWNILRDDFMMGATMKDWDKESDEEQKAAAAGAESESDSDR
ncbi:RRP15-like protein [Callorhinchus milii]|nr:RRP15-like protein [Callorhinchus milii]|eukprot:gi/632972533/ref/XP_007902705.1/ PREDICTED: RRP15-like protein [Callorhinchus milii]